MYNTFEALGKQEGQSDAYVTAVKTRASPVTYSPAEEAESDDDFDPSEALENERDTEFLSNEESDTHRATALAESTIRNREVAAALERLRASYAIN